jgi:hypothetical protein
VLTLRVLYAHTRHSVLGPLTALLVIGGCWQALYSQDPLWGGRSIDTTLWVHTYALVVVGPLMATAAAWSTASAPARLLDSISPRTLSTTSVTWATIMIWASLAHLLVLLAASWRSASIAGAGLPSWPVVMLTEAVLGAQLAAGMVIGSVVRSRVLAPALALLIGYGTYVAYVLSDAGNSVHRFYPLIQEHWDPELLPSISRLAWTTVWLCAVTTLLLAAVAALQRSGRLAVSGWWAARLAAVALTAVVTCGLLASFTGPPGATLLAQVRPRSDVVCRAVGPGDVCVWRPDAYQLPTLQSGLRLAQTAAGSLPGFPQHVAEPLISSTGRPVDEEILFPTSPSSAADAAATVLDALLPTPTGECDLATNPPELGGLPWDQLFGAVLYARANVPTEGPGVDSPFFERQLKAVLGLPRPAQDAWLEEAFTAYQGCRRIPAPHA